MGLRTPVDQDDEEEEEEDEELVRDLTGGGALAAVQPPAASGVPELRNAPRECAIRMLRGKAANTGARGPITPATGPGQASTRFCNLAEALRATGATFGFKAAKSVCSFCVLQLHNHPGADHRRQGDRGQKIGDDCSSAVAIPPCTRAYPFAAALALEDDASLCEVSAALCRGSDEEWACFVGSKGIVFGAHDGHVARVAFRRACRLATGTNAAPMVSGPRRAWGTSVVFVLTKLERSGPSCNLVFFHDGLAVNQDAPLTDRLAAARRVWFSPRQRPGCEISCSSIGAPVTLVRSSDEAQSWVKSVKGTLLRARPWASADVLLERLHLGGETMEQRAAHGGRSISTASPGSHPDSNYSASHHTPQSCSSGHASLYTPQSGQKMSQDSPIVDLSGASPHYGVTVSPRHASMEMCDSGVIPVLTSTDAEASINDTVDSTEDNSDVLDTSSLSIILFGDNCMDVS